MKRKGEAQQLSAFAAKKLALEEAEAAAISALETDQTLELEQESIASDAESAAEGISAEESRASSSEDGQDVQSHGHNRFLALAQSTGQLTVHRSRSASVTAAESLRPLPAKISEVNGSLQVELTSDEAVSIQGRFLLTVTQGIVLLLGAAIQQSMGPVLVEIPETDSWPILSQWHVDSRPVKFTMSQCMDEVPRVLGHYPLGRALFPTSSESVQPSLLRPSSLTLSELKDVNGLPKLFDVMFFAGPKNSGKSTLARQRTNQALSLLHNVLYIDLDAGQPEFSPPGLISAYLLTSPADYILNVGPFATHCSKAVRSHWIGETSAKEDPDHYYACALDLLSLIGKQTYPITAIINTPGWIKGTGLELVSSLITATHRAHLSKSIHVDHLGHSDLQKYMPEGVRFAALPAAPLREANAISAADARSLNLLTYFHRSGLSSGWQIGPLAGTHTWSTSFDPKSGKAGIHAIHIMRESLRPLDLVAAINGTIMALIEIDKTALRDPLQYTQHGIAYLDNDGTPLDPSTSACIALVIVAGLDLRDRRIHLISPITATQLDTYTAAESKRAILLVSGGIEIPAAAMFSNTTDIRGERPYVTRKPGEGVGWQAWHVRRNIGRRLRQT